MNHVRSLLRLLTGHIKPEQEQNIVDIQITGLTLDSRNISSGMLFVALQGTQQHGIAYAKKAESLGAVAVIWERVDGIDLPELSVPLIAIDQLSAKLGDIANRFYGNASHELNIIGITGTDGKTSVSHFLAQSLNAQGENHCAVIGTLGIGLPDQLEKASHTTPDVITVHDILAKQKQAGIKTVAMEVSSHALDQGRVNGVQFDTAILTNLTRDHLDYHGTIEAYAAAKEKLFYWQGLKNIVVNTDDAMGLRLAKELADKDITIFAYGFTEQKGLSDKLQKIQVKQAQFDYRGIVADIVTPIGESVLIAPILAKFNLSNLLAVLSALIAMGYSLDDALNRIKQVHTVAGRMERVANKTVSNAPLIVVDFAHTPGALKQALLASREHSDKRLICVFGCGGDRDKGKRPLMAAIAEQLADQVFVTDDNPRTENPVNIFADIKQGFKQADKVIFEHNRQTAIQLAITSAQQGDVVLIAGKGHENVQIINNKKYPFDDRVVAKQALEKVA